MRPKEYKFIGYTSPTKIKSVFSEKLNVPKSNTAPSVPRNSVSSIREAKSVNYPFNNCSHKVNSGATSGVK